MAKTGHAPVGESKTGEARARVVQPEPLAVEAATPEPTLRYGIAAPVTSVLVGPPRASGGAVFDWTFDQAFSGDILEPSLVYGIQTPTTDVQVTPQEPAVPASGTARLIQPDAATVTVAVPTQAIGYLQWRIAGNVIYGSTEEIATHRLLTLAFRVETQNLLDDLRALKSDEGQADVLGTDSGGFRAVDRANGGNTFVLIPPVTREPLRRRIDYHVDRYEEDLVSQTVDEWQVEVEFVPADNRTDTRSISETAASDEWGLTTRYGTIATDRVDAEFLGTGADGVERFELTTRLTYQQALAFEAALSKLEGVRVRAIPDATNVAVDDTGGDNTLTVDPPTAGDEVPSGDYVVMSFESRRLNDSFQSVSIEIADKG